MIMFKILNKKIAGYELLIMIISFALLWLTTKTANSFAPNNHPQKVLVLAASDTDSTESDDDDDEWEA